MQKLLHKDDGKSVPPEFHRHLEIEYKVRATYETPVTAKWPGPDICNIDVNWHLHHRQPRAPSQRMHMRCCR